MSDAPQTQPAGWYYAQGDPPGTQRYWDGSQWQGGPQPVPGAPQVSASGPTLAEPINRIGARVIDGILWIVLFVIVGIIVPGGANFGSSTADVSFADRLLTTVLSTLLVAGYEIFMIGSRGATLGKMAMGAKVVRADGSPADFRDAAMRMALFIGVQVVGLIVGSVAALGALVGLVSLGIFVVSFVFLFTDKMRQTLWDKVAKTIVVSTR